MSEQLEVEWRDMGEAPPETPVIAQYRTWNRPNGELTEHVVWFFNRDWRPYPQSNGVAYADRWRPMPAPARVTPASEGVEYALRQYKADLRYPVTDSGSLERRDAMIDAALASFSHPPTIDIAQERMREALEPFARRANAYDGIPSSKYFGDTDCEIRHYDTVKVEFTLGDCRRARAALSFPPAPSQDTDHVG